MLALGCSSSGVADSPESASKPSTPAPTERTLETQTPNGEERAARQDEQVPPIPAKKKSTACPKLESVLYDLTLSPDPATVAAERDIFHEDGSVRVVIELSQPDAELPDRYQVEIERQQGPRIRALVPLGILCELSNEDVVDFLHVPITGVSGY